MHTCWIGFEILIALNVQSETDASLFFRKRHKLPMLSQPWQQKWGYDSEWNAACSHKSAILPVSHVIQGHFKNRVS